MNYELKDKINVTKALLSELAIKSWQEIEQLQTQIANLADGPINDKLRQLFKNLLTSYYVFTGGIELLESEPLDDTNKAIEFKVEEPSPVVEAQPEILSDIDLDISKSETIPETTNDYDTIEPFEYFVDFDEPTGDPITDEDLYNN